MRFSLRILLIAVAVIGVCCAAAVSHFRKMSEKRENAQGLALLADAPGMYNGFANPVGLVRCVNFLRKLGKRRALLILREYADLESDGGGTTILVVQLLFTSKRKSPPQSRFSNVLRLRGEIPFQVEVVSNTGTSSVTSLVWPSRKLIPSTEEVTAARQELLSWASGAGDIRKTPLVPSSDLLKMADELGATINNNYIAYCLRVQAYNALELGNDPHVPVDEDVTGSGWEEVKKTVLRRGLRWNSQKSKYDFDEQLRVLRPKTPEAIHSTNQTADDRVQADTEIDSRKETISYVGQQWKWNTTLAFGKGGRVSGRGSVCPSTCHFGSER